MRIVREEEVPRDAQGLKEQYNILAELVSII